MNCPYAEFWFDGNYGCVLTGTECDEFSCDIADEFEDDCEDDCEEDGVMDNDTKIEVYKNGFFEITHQYNQYNGIGKWLISANKLESNVIVELTPLAMAYLAELIKTIEL